MNVGLAVSNKEKKVDITIYFHIFLGGQKQTQLDILVFNVIK